MPGFLTEMLNPLRIVIRSWAVMATIRSTGGLVLIPWLAAKVMTSTMPKVLRMFSLRLKTKAMIPCSAKPPSISPSLEASKMPFLPVR